jgi:hypothetical protein
MRRMFILIAVTIAAVVATAGCGSSTPTRNTASTMSDARTTGATARASASVTAIVTTGRASTTAQSTVEPRSNTARPTVAGVRTSTPRSTAAPRPSATGPTSTPTATEPVTRRVVVRPVRDNGTPAAGFRVVRENDGEPVVCDDVSPVAVSGDIRFCGDSALDTVACWQSAAANYVLCLRDPRTHVLARIHITGGFRAIAAPARPAPQALVLDDGTRCLIRDGGAWSALPGHPNWYGDYGCNGNVEIYGPGAGIDDSSSRWTVHAVTWTGGRASVRTRSVVAAYFVGTA